MRNTAAKVQCTNPSCQVYNLESENFCSKCRTPISKRYLWAIGESSASFKIGEIVGDRYVVKQSRLFLDTKPALAPEVPQLIPDHLSPYLWLFTHHLHIPQLYGILPNPSDDEIWLLEYNYLPPTKTALLDDLQLLPPLAKVWPEATPLRQLNWLWQITNLWKPLLDNRVAASLLNPNLLRTRGPIIQLQELDLDPDQTPELSDLGHCWSEWIDNSSPSIKEFLSQLCEHLKNSQIQRLQQLLSILDGAIYQWGQKQQRTYQIFTLTDAGPSREHNEDSCFPVPGTIVSNPPIAIVCDGVGGQDGGEIASGLAIKFLEEQLPKLSFDTQQWRPKQNLRQIDKIIRQANDHISQRNDQEQRRERRRMGTTLLMAVAESHEIYLNHIGDSRIYLITKNGAYQLTVDDDLACREVRLGYSTYRAALQSPNSGALIQALGMAPSNSLHLHHKRLIVDEDCLFLLCSDGLSDFDRVEQYWESQILPVINQGISLATASAQLMKIANEKNGHDNVTVALISCQVSSDQDQKHLIWSEIKPSTVTTIPPEDDDDPSTSELPTQPLNRSSTSQNSTPVTPPSSSRSITRVSAPNTETVESNSPFKKLLIAFLSLIILGGLLYWGWTLLSSRFLRPSDQSDEPTTNIPAISLPPLEKGDIIQITEAISISEEDTAPNNSTSESSEEPAPNNSTSESSEEPAPNNSTSESSEEPAPDSLKTFPADACLEILAVTNTEYQVRRYSQPESKAWINKEDLPKDKYKKLEKTEAENTCL